MKNSFFLPAKSPDPSEILEIFRDFHRYEKTEGDLPRHIRRLKKDTVIYKLGVAFNTNLQTASRIGKFFNETFEINVAPEDWKKVLEPIDKTPLWEACEFIAQHATIPEIRPATVLGCESESAGAFLALRSVLREMNDNGVEILPSTRLTDFPLKCVVDDVFLAVWKLAPAALPKLTYNTTTVLSPAKRWVSEATLRFAKWLFISGMLLVPVLLVIGISLQAVGFLTGNASYYLWLPRLDGASMYLAYFMVGSSAIIAVVSLLIKGSGTSTHLHYPKTETFGELARLIAENLRKRSTRSEKRQPSAKV